MNYPVEKKDLFQPSYDDVSKILNKALLNYFAEVSATVEQCPDLTQAPWCLAAGGICGKPHVLDVGGCPYLVPIPNRQKIYRFDDLKETLPPTVNFFIGPGAGPFHKVGTNSEMMANIVVGENSINHTRISTSSDKEVFKTEMTKENEFGLLGNLLASEGKGGQVIRIKVKQRIGEKNFIDSIRECLSSSYPEDMMGMGGVFVIKSGRAKVHVMPAFSYEPLHTDDDVHNWLRFTEVSAPFTCLSVFYNIDAGMDLRISHSHGFNATEGGHYHYDTTPQEVEYEACLVVAETLVRVDRPLVTHNVGRD